MDEHNNHLREHILQTSGGWLGEGVILISDLLGVWDIFVLCVVFILSWVVMRTTWMEISLCFGLVYDLGIPLQYVCDEGAASLHKSHLDNYWPAFVIGCVIEAALYFISHPDLFTLVVCVKTLLCLFLWLRRGPSGDTVKLASPSSAQPRAPSTTSPAQTFVDERFPNLDAQLKDKGYKDPEARQGMVMSLRGVQSPGAENNVNTWLGKTNALTQNDIERREAKYKPMYRDQIAKLTGPTPSSSRHPPGGAHSTSSQQAIHLGEPLRKRFNETMKQQGFDRGHRAQVAQGLKDAKTVQDVINTLTKANLPDPPTWLRVLGIDLGGGAVSAGRQQPQPDIAETAKAIILEADEWPESEEMRKLVYRTILSKPPAEANAELKEWKQVLGMRSGGPAYHHTLGKLMRPYKAFQ